MQPQPVFDTKPLLRPAQVEEGKNEIKALQAKLESPHIEDKGEVFKQLRRVKKSFEEQVPRAPESVEEEGRMSSRSRELLTAILEGMPSQEEMRKAPPGAVTKHMNWEKRNKQRIAEWKNLQLRMTHGEDPEAANLERHRPVGSSLNMDNAYIPGKMFFMPPMNAGLPVAFSDEQIAYLKSVGLEVGVMNNEQRAQVKEVIAPRNTVTVGPDAGIGLSVDPVRSAAGKAGAAKKRTISQAQKDAMAAGRAAKKAKGK